MREAREVVGSDFDAAYGDVQEGLHNIRRMLSAMHLLRYPDVEQILAEVRALRRWLKTESVEVNVLTEDQQITIASDPTGDRILFHAVPARESLCVLSVGTDLPLQVSDINQDPLVNGHAAVEKWSSWAAAPVHVSDSCVGTVCALELEPRIWTDREEKLLVQTAVRIGDAVTDWVASETH